MTPARKSAARIALLLVVVAAFIVGAQPSAQASCGFVSTSLREQVDDADAVIVGTVTEAGVADTDEPKQRFGRPLRWTIDVERDVKGNVGDTVSFHSGWTGAGGSNDFVARNGQRVGLLLSRRDGELWATDCDKRPPGDVLAAAEPLPPPRGRGASLLLASGRFGAPRVALLDEHGVFTRFGDGAADAVVGVCPGERFAVEAITDRAFRDAGGRTRIEIRELRTMDVVRAVDLPDGITMQGRRRPIAVSCRSGSADDVLVAAEAGIYTLRVVRLRDGAWETVYGAKARAVTFLPNGFAVVSHNGEKFELAVHDANGDVRMRLGPLPSFKHLSISEPVRFAADPSGRYVAGANEEPDTGGDNLFVADLEQRKVARARVPWVAGLAWAGRDLVLGPLYGRDADGYVDETSPGGVRIYDTKLDRKATWDGWSGLQPVVVGERLYGIRPVRRGTTRGLAIVSAPYLTGPERVENQLGDTTVDELIALSGEGAAVQRPRLTWAAIGLAVFLLALVAIVVRSRRTGRGEPPGASGAFSS